MRIEEAGIEVTSSDVTMLPTSLVELDSAEVVKPILRLIDALDEHDDVQDVLRQLRHPRVGARRARRLTAVGRTALRDYWATPRSRFRVTDRTPRCRLTAASTHATAPRIHPVEELEPIRVPVAWL